MVRYDVATSILVIRSILILNIPLPITSFIPQQTPSSWTLPEIPAGAAVLRVTEKRSASVAASYYDNDNEEEEEEKDGQSSSTSTSTSTSNKPLASGGGSGTAYLDTLGGKDDVIIRRERKVLDQSGTGGGKTTTYDVVLPLNKNVQSSSSSFPSSSTTVTEATKPPPATRRLGIQLRQISARGEISDTSLDLDSLRYLSVAQEVYRDMNDATPDNVGEEGPLGSVQPLNLPVNFVLNPNMKGIIVSGVVRGSVAWDAGVRSGDFLMATSATLGDVSQLTMPTIIPNHTLNHTLNHIHSNSCKLILHLIIFIHLHTYHSLIHSLILYQRSTINHYTKSKIITRCSSHLYIILTYVI